MTSAQQSRRAKVRQQVRRALERLVPEYDGDRFDAARRAAHRLDEFGVRGERNSASLCPLAVYLQPKVNASAVLIEDGGVSLFVGGEATFVPLPLWALTFVEAWDEWYWFPFLERWRS